MREDQPRRTIAVTAATSAIRARTLKTIIGAREGAAAGARDDVEPGVGAAVITLELVNNDECERAALLVTSDPEARASALSPTDAAAPLSVLRSMSPEPASLRGAGAARRAICRGAPSSAFEA